MAADVVHSAAFVETQRRLDTKIDKMATQQDELKRQNARVGTKKALDQRVGALQNKNAKLKGCVDRGNDFYQWGVSLEAESELKLTEVDPSPTVMVADQELSSTAVLHSSTPLLASATVLHVTTGEHCEISSTLTSLVDQMKDELQKARNRIAALEGTQARLLLA